MFPMIEERGGDMSPTTSDFSQILELQQFKRLYEEQEEKVRIRLADKDEQIAGLHAAIQARDGQLEEMRQRLQEMAQDRERIRADYGRLRQEAQEKIDKLMTRIKELNVQRTGGGAEETGKKSGIFR
jgi:chromosome segregation ATPase